MAILGGLLLLLTLFAIVDLVIKDSSRTKDVMLPNYESIEYPSRTLPPGYRGYRGLTMDPLAISARLAWAWLTPDEMVGLTLQAAMHKAMALPDDRIFAAKDIAYAAAWTHFEAATAKFLAVSSEQARKIISGLLATWASAALPAVESIERYDFSIPPPGGLVVKDMPAEQSLADAWARHKACTDPPGLHVVWEPESGSEPNGKGEMRVETSIDGPTLVLWHQVCRAGRLAVLAKDGPHLEARLVAWARYEACLALEPNEGDLLEDHDGAPVPAAPVWPLCLTWSNDDLASVEHWRNTYGEAMPEVLRRRRMIDGTVEIVDEVRAEMPEVSRG